MTNYSKSSTNVQKLTTMGILCAIAYVATFLTHNIPVFPSAPFLSIDLKDAVLAIGGFIFGPIAALAMTVVVCLVEMVTISSTGVIGLIMNVLSTGAFVFGATFIYSRKKSFRNAIIGLAFGTLLMTGVMVLWNWLITPIYMGIDRSIIVPMLPTVFLPFNALKGLLNSAITMFLYKGVVTALKKAGLLPKESEIERKDGEGKKKNITPIISICSAMVIISCILVILVIRGIL